MSIFNSSQMSSNSLNEEFKEDFENNYPNQQNQEQLQSYSLNQFSEQQLPTNYLNQNDINNNYPQFQNQQQNSSIQQNQEQFQRENSNQFNEQYYPYLNQGYLNPNYSNENAFNIDYNQPQNYQNDIIQGNPPMSASPQKVSTTIKKEEKPIQIVKLNKETLVQIKKENENINWNDSNQNKDKQFRDISQLVKFCIDLLQKFQKLKKDFDKMKIKEFLDEYNIEKREELNELQNKEVLFKKLKERSLKNV